MKCLLCSLEFNTDEELFDHYVSFHKVDKSNWFFKKLFGTKNSNVLRKCLRCDRFIYDKKSQSEHNFLNHYNEGYVFPFEDKPIAIKNLRDKIKIYNINYENHKDFYIFFSADQCVTDFLQNCKSKIVQNNKKKTFKCSFVIQNQQLPSFAGNEPSLNLRYWSTSTYEGIHFNDYIYFNLKGEILNRVIINGQSGSSWFFRKFSSISLEELIGNIDLDINV